jgi:endonuclease YncB( thermonuclease family)
MTLLACVDFLMQLPSLQARRVLAGLLVAALALPVSAKSLSGTNPLIGLGTVYRVVDADTFVVNVVDPAIFKRFVEHAGNDKRRLRYLDTRYQSIRIRLANINTPESVHANAARNTVAGKAISQEVKRLIEGETIEFRCHDWGNYGRSICNVGLQSRTGSQDLGQWLIGRGYSEYVTRWGKNPYYHDQYVAAERDARRQ